MSRVLPSYFWDSAQDTLALWKRHTRMPWMSHGLCPELKCDEEGALAAPACETVSITVFMPEQ